MVYQDRLETNLLQLFGHPETSDWFPIISVITFEINIVVEQKRAELVTIFFINLHCTQIFYYRCSGVRGYYTITVHKNPHTN